jgi:putative acetyltransferase
MTLTIAQESPLSETGRALIAGSQAALRAVYTADECFTFTPDELAKPSIRFFVARRDGQPVGCVALCDCGHYAEIKRLYVAPTAQNSGTGRKLMSHLEQAARQLGHRIIRLETGPKLTAGVALYQKIGYQIRGPFGDYADHAASLFMEKHLS